MELIRQPLFLLLMTSSAVFSVFLASIPYFGFGDDPKLVKDSVLAVMLLTGLFGSILSASNSVAREIRTGTDFAVLAKPVGRVQFLLVKYLALAAAISFLTYVNVLAGLDLVCSTRLEMVSTLTICSAFFLLGLMSDYLFGRKAEAGSWWASFFYTVLPNWQLLWVADALEEGKRIPWSYLETAFGYMAAYVTAALAVALCLFEDRELT